MKKTALVVAIALLGLSRAASAQDGGTFCADPWGGPPCTAPRLQPGYYTLAQLTAYGFQNDWASSFYTSDSAVVGQLFVDNNFSGAHWQLSQSQGADLSNVGADNAVSSAIIRTGVTFFQDANYEGVATSVYGLSRGSCYTLAQLQGFGFVNDTVSSVIIPNGWVVDLYRDDNFSGTKWTLSQMDSNSENFANFGGNDVVSSVCVR